MFDKCQRKITKDSSGKLKDVRFCNVTFVMPQSINFFFAFFILCNFQFQCSAHNIYLQKVTQHTSCHDLQYQSAIAGGSDVSVKNYYTCRKYQSPQRLVDRSSKYWPSLYLSLIGKYFHRYPFMGFLIPPHTILVIHIS